MVSYPATTKKISLALEANSSEAISILYQVCSFLKNKNFL
ncbi:unnamed protein product [Arabidopsis halleri]